MGACASMEVDKGEREEDLTAERLVKSEYLYALVSHQGDRNYEDCAKATPVVFGDSSAYISAMYTVLDGHGGATVATKAADTLHDNIMEESTGRQSHELGDAIRAAFTRTDSECCESAAPEECCVGAVCCSAVLTADQRLWIGNVGDVRAVLCRGGRAEVLTIDHRADNAEEVARVTGAGGTVQWSGGSPRVQGRLGVTRALGDVWAKPYGVISEPDVRCIDLSDDCEFLIIASDGLWDAVSSNEAVRIVSDAIRDKLRQSTRVAASPPPSPGGRASRTNSSTNGGGKLPRAGSAAAASPEDRMLRAARLLAARAREMFSHDDVTVCIVDLQQHLASSASSPTCSVAGALRSETNYSVNSTTFSSGASGGSAMSLSSSRGGVSATGLNGSDTGDSSLHAAHTLAKVQTNVSSSASSLNAAAGGSGDCAAHIVAQSPLTIAAAAAAAALAPQSPARSRSSSGVFTGRDSIAEEPEELVAAIIREEEELEAAAAKELLLRESSNGVSTVAARAAEEGACTTCRPPARVPSCGDRLGAASQTARPTTTCA